MKNPAHTRIHSKSAVTALALTVSLLAGCASTPESPAGAAGPRSNLEAIQNDPNLADQARVELRDAEEAVRLAEEPLPASEERLADHRIYMANQRVGIARAKAETAYAEEQRQRRGEERDAERLANRTDQVERSRRNEAELQRRIDAMQAETTQRGIVLTLGDVLFASGSAELELSGYDKLNRLVEFLNQYPDRDVIIQGHTDTVGSAELNMRLSQQRADSVRSHLARRGIDTVRLSARGMGQGQPVATNDTEAGRQQNRRVEIIIENEQQTAGQ